MSRFLRIAGGRVYDPANGVDGELRDILVADGRIVAAFPPPPDGPVSSGAVRTLDARGLVVMPGGVDVHCHIASSSVNRARAMQGEEHATHVHAARPAAGGEEFRGGSGLLTPSTFLTGYRYAALGYTSALEAAVSPSGARQTHLELDDTPNLDAAFLLLLANHQHVIELLDRDDEDGVVAFVAHLLRVTGAYGIKVVNPGGVASWREDARRNTVETIDDPVAGTRVTPRRILEAMATAAERLRLPHPPHVHCNRLGLAGNVATTLDTLRALEGRRVHLAHVQFHAYGRGKKGGLTSAAAAIGDYFAGHPLVSADVGQVMFGDAFTLTGDTPLEHLLWRLTGTPGRRYVSLETELEGGCGLMPIRYADRQRLASLQWAIGLELLLGAADPWRMLLSTDHPNGASFLSYPAIIAALMSRAVREEQMARAHPGVMKRSGLRGLAREMSLSEIAVLTRAGPARVLGLTHKGHLGPGADADVTLYHDRPSDPQRMFESPRYVLKAGRVLVEDGELRAAQPGVKHAAGLERDERGERITAEWFARYGSYSVDQLGLHESERAKLKEVRGV